jgi:hypothetical protein
MRFATPVFALLMLALGLGVALALSEQLHEPKIRFPKGYNDNRGQQITDVLKNPESKFLDGIISYWEPDWATTLVYGGDTKALQTQLADLGRIHGLKVKVTLSRDLAKETGSALQTGSWWVKYRHTAPDVLEVRVNLASDQIDLKQLELWQTMTEAK